MMKVKRLSYLKRNELSHVQQYRRRFGTQIPPENLTLMGIRAASKRRQSCPADSDELYRRFDANYWNFVREYQLQDTIMESRHFTVTRGCHFGEGVAIKHLNFTWDKQVSRSAWRRRLHSEYTMLRSLDHRNIISALNFVETRNESYMVMPIMEGMDLLDRLRQLPGSRMAEAESKKVIWQILDATKYLHDRHIVHRDLKLENVLFRCPTSLALTICDFETATYVRHDEDIEDFDIGTPEYCPPEIMNKMSYSYPVDCWCIGIIMYETVMASTPIRMNRKGRRIPHIVFKDGYWRYVLTDNCKELIKKLLTPDPSRRITASDALMQPWIVKDLIGGSFNLQITPHSCGL